MGVDLAAAAANQDCLTVCDRIRDAGLVAAGTLGNPIAIAIAVACVWSASMGVSSNVCEALTRRARRSGLLFGRLIQLREQFAADLNFGAPLPSKEKGNPAACVNG